MDTRELLQLLKEAAQAINKLEKRVVTLERRQARDAEHINLLAHMVTDLEKVVDK